MKKMTKTQCIRIHLRRKAAERFNVVLTKKDRQDLVAQIASGKAVFVGRDSRRVSKFIVTLGDKKAICVYDRLRKEPVTLLPMDWLDKPRPRDKYANNFNQETQ
jgi:hypothetical protein